MSNSLTRTTSNGRWLKIGAVALLLAVAAYWYWSPLVAMHQMREAAKAGDADAFSDYVDYPRLRESMKGQLSALLTKRLADAPQPDNEFAKAGAALGVMLGMTFVDKMVDAFVRPETVMQAMQQGKVTPTQPEQAASGPVSTDPDAKINWKSERRGVDKYIAYATRPGDAPEKRIGLVMERTGFAHWKLTEIRLPSEL